MIAVRPVRGFQADSQFVRPLFAITLLLLGLQYAVVETAGEPYPAIMMPRFTGNSGYENGAVSLRVIEVPFLESRPADKLVGR